MNATTLPTDVKTLRKALLYCRDMLDIFVYSFPNETEVGSKTLDVWIKIRGDFDVGYTTIGNLQDLAKSGVDYNQKELNKRRNPCLAWKSSFLKDSTKYDYELFVNKISTSELFFRDPSDLSAFYWQYVQVFPQLDLTGVQNIAALEKGLISLAKLNYTELIELTAPYEDDQHTFFHDYRKIVRSITTISDYFTVFKQNSCVTSTMETLNSMYDNLGNINDEVVAYDFYIQNQEPSKAEKTKEQIIQDWSSFITWLNSSFSANYQFQCLLSNLV